MKLVVAFIVLAVGSLFAIDYVSKYAMGGIESGMPGGGEGKFADYHDNNFFAYWLSGGEEEYKPSDSALNPFAQSKETTCGSFKKFGYCSCQDCPKPNATAMPSAAGSDNPFVK